MLLSAAGSSAALSTFCTGEGELWASVCWHKSLLQPAGHRLAQQRDPRLLALGLDRVGGCTRGMLHGHCGPARTGLCREPLGCAPCAAGGAGLPRAGRCSLLVLGGGGTGPQTSPQGPGAAPLTHAVPAASPCHVLGAATCIAAPLCCCLPPPSPGPGPRSPPGSLPTLLGAGPPRCRPPQPALSPCR